MQLLDLIKEKEPADVTGLDLELLELEIKRTTKRVDTLQKEYRKLTGKDYKFFR